MNIFIHELKTYRKSTIIWSLSLIAIMIIFMSMYSTFAEDAKGFMKIVENYPEAIRNAMGFNQENFFTILGFYSFPLSFITLCAAIQAMNLGTSIVNKEVREKTADFLLTKPVTRTKILTAKLLAAFVSIVVTNIFYFAAASFVALQVQTDDFSLKIFLLLSLTIFFIQLIFLSLGIIISVIVQKIKSVLTVSLATVFAFYFVGMFSDTTGDEVKRYFSPFKYFDTAYIIKHSSYETTFLIAGAVIIILAIAASYVVYSKKDIHAV
ncbi:ABC transporter permease subunit [Lysinibacillus varians]|uniref:ABC transporter permease n=1 Tax=Lysinibacillus varians TaxID=1145276 RepID=A0ABY2TJS0_9BACI|nr:ABC transporter permease subunit [Lysinibacillus varians]AHN21373.1 ABC transporter permease [Lysinibacillus varians]TKI67146.1 ABC transporter permease [Lysinibacillus varians]